MATGNFEVLGLRTQATDPDGLCGRFQVVKRAGVVNNNLLDLMVFIEWRGQRGGNQTFQMASMRSDRGMRFVAPNP